MLEKQEKEMSKLVQQCDAYNNVVNNEWPHEEQLENLKKDLKKLMAKMEAESIKKNNELDVFDNVPVVKTVVGEKEYKNKAKMTPTLESRTKTKNVTRMRIQNLIH
jgi:hypothetical protein